jgi:hypothetical protein
MKTFDPPSSEVIPKSIKKALGFSFKTTRWEKAFRIVKMEWKFPGQMTLFLKMEKLLKKFTKRYKNQGRIRLFGHVETALRKVPKTL